MPHNCKLYLRGPYFVCVPYHNSTSALEGFQVSSNLLPEWPDAPGQVKKVYGETWEGSYLASLRQAVVTPFTDRDLSLSVRLFYLPGALTTLRFWESENLIVARRSGPMWSDPSKNLGHKVSNGILWAETSHTCCYISATEDRAFSVAPDGRGRALEACMWVPPDSSWWTFSLTDPAIYLCCCLYNKSEPWVRLYIQSHEAF